MPWLQDFSLGGHYGPTEVPPRRRAAQDDGIERLPALERRSQLRRRRPAAIGWAERVSPAAFALRHPDGPASRPSAVPMIIGTANGLGETSDRNLDARQAEHRWRPTTPGSWSPLHDGDGRFLTARRRSAVRCSASDRRDLIGRRCSDLVHPEDPRASRPRSTGVPGEPAAGLVTTLCRLRHDEGYWAWLEITVRPALGSVRRLHHRVDRTRHRAGRRPTGGGVGRGDAAPGLRPRPVADGHASASTTVSSGSTWRSARCSTPRRTSWSAAAWPASRRCGGDRQPTGSRPEWPPAASTRSPAPSPSSVPAAPAVAYDPALVARSSNGPPARRPARPRYTGPATAGAGAAPAAGRPSHPSRPASSGPPGPAPEGVTGLTSRPLLLDRLHIALARPERESQFLVMFFVDVDGVDKILGRHGRRALESVLTAAGNRLRATVRSGRHRGALRRPRVRRARPVVAASTDVVTIRQRLARAVATGRSPPRAASSGSAPGSAQRSSGRPRTARPSRCSSGPTLRWAPTAYQQPGPVGSLGGTGGYPRLDSRRPQ